MMSCKSASASQESYRLRKAYLNVGNAEEFHAGLLCGQATLTNLRGKLSDDDLFDIFEEVLRDIEHSKTHLVACLIGMVDALLSARKTLPREYAALLEPKYGTFHCSRIRLFQTTDTIPIPLSGSLEKSRHYLQGSRQGNAATFTNDSHGICVCGN